MRELPLLINDPMVRAVRAVREGRKTVTRRVLKPQPPADNPWVWVVEFKRIDAEVPDGCS